MSKLKVRVLVGCATGAFLALTGLGGVAQAAPAQPAPASSAASVTTVQPNSTFWL